MQSADIYRSLARQARNEVKGEILSVERQTRSRHTIPNNRAMIHVPSAQPMAMKNPHTNQTSNALAVTSGNMTSPPFVSASHLVAELFGSFLMQYATPKPSPAALARSVIDSALSRRVDSLRFCVKLQRAEDGTPR